MFYDNFMRLCNERGVKPSRAALEMGFQKSAVTRWKTSTPTDANKRRVADYFGVTVDQLMGTEKAATSKGDGWSSQKTALYEDVDSMTDEELDDFMRLWNAWKAARSDKE